MAKEFPDWVDPWKAADGRRIFTGSVPFSTMKRLLPLLAEDEGSVCFTVRFDRDSQNRAMVDVSVKAELPLLCQVSLEVYRHAVERSSRLVVIEDEAQQQGLPEGYEGTCAEDGRLSVASLAEDECLLAIPQVPRKSGLKFEPYSTGGEAPEEDRTRSPFAGLGDLLKARGTGQDSGNH